MKANEASAFWESVYLPVEDIEPLLEHVATNPTPFIYPMFCFGLRSSPLVQLNRVWVADITYLPLKTGGFAYLASLMDLCSRRVVGWSVDAQMAEETGIGWTDHTFNPWWGCHKKSPECTNCDIPRFIRGRADPFKGPVLLGDGSWKAAREWNRKAREDDHQNQPLFSP